MIEEKKSTSWIWAIIYLLIPEASHLTLEKGGLKFYIQKTKIMALGPIIHGK